MLGKNSQNMFKIHKLRIQRAVVNSPCWTTHNSHKLKKNARNIFTKYVNNAQAMDIKSSGYC